MQENELTRQMSTSLYDITKMNSERADKLRIACNQNGATLFLVIGLHHDKIAHRIFPVICGGSWMTKELAIQLLQDALQQLQGNGLDDGKMKI